jgi:hypothetical protein
MFSLRISFNQQDSWPMFSSLFSPTSPCFLKHPCSLSLSLSLSLLLQKMWSLTVRRGFRWGCFLSVPNVFPSSSQSVPSRFPKFSIVFWSSSPNSQLCSDQVPQILNCVLIKFPNCSHHVPQVPNVFLTTFPIATFIPYKCSLCRVGPSVNTLRAQLNFSFQTQFLKFGFGTKSTQKSISFTP